MTQVSNSVEGTDRKPAVKVVVEVNNDKVKLNERRPTGAEIKAAAIAQGVPIQPTFQLILKKPGQSSRVIGDNEEVHVKDGDKFRAIPPDDNS